MATRREKLLALKRKLLRKSEAPALARRDFDKRVKRAARPRSLPSGKGKPIARISLKRVFGSSEKEVELKRIQQSQPSLRERRVLNLPSRSRMKRIQHAPNSRKRRAALDDFIRETEIKEKTFFSKFVEISRKAASFKGLEKSVKWLDKNLSILEKNANQMKSSDHGKAKRIATSISPVILQLDVWLKEVKSERVKAENSCNELKRNLKRENSLLRKTRRVEKKNLRILQKEKDKEIGFEDEQVAILDRLKDTDEKLFYCNKQLLKLVKLSLKEVGYDAKLMQRISKLIVKVLVKLDNILKFKYSIFKKDLKKVANKVLKLIKSMEEISKQIQESSIKYITFFDRIEKLNQTKSLLVQERDLYEQTLNSLLVREASS